MGIPCLIQIYPIKLIILYQLKKNNFNLIVIKFYEGG